MSDNPAPKTVERMSRGNGVPRDAYTVTEGFFKVTLAPPRERD